MKALITLLILAVIASALSSCSAFKERPTIIQPTPVFHPPAPLPLTKPVIEFRIITPDTVGELNGQYVYMSLSWEDYLTLGQYIKELVKKFQEYHLLLCHYREDLNEIICRKDEEQAKLKRSM